jgi:hypothetical protein
MLIRAAFCESVNPPPPIAAKRAAFCESVNPPPPATDAATLATTLAALATPPLEVVAPPPDGAEIVGIDGTAVETLGVLIVGTLTVGVEIFETLGKNGMALYAEIKALIPATAPEIKPFKILTTPAMTSITPPAI